MLCTGAAFTMVKMSIRNMATSKNSISMGEALAVGASRVSVFHHLMWPCMFQDAVKAEDRQALLQDRELQLDFVQNMVVAGIVGCRFLEDVLVHRESTLNWYLIPVGKVDDVMA